MAARIYHNAHLPGSTHPHTVGRIAQWWRSLRLFLTIDSLVAAGLRDVLGTWRLGLYPATGSRHPGGRATRLGAELRHGGRLCNVQGDTSAGARPPAVTEPGPVCSPPRSATAAVSQRRSNNLGASNWHNRTTRRPSIYRVDVPSNSARPVDCRWQTFSGKLLTGECWWQNADGRLLMADRWWQTTNGRLLIADHLWQTADGRLQTADGRLQTADGRLQTADGRLQTADGRLQTADGRLQTADGRLQTADGRLQTADGRLQTADGRLQTADGRLQTADGRLQTADGRLQTADGRLQTADGRLQTADGRLFSYDRLLMVDPIRMPFSVQTAVEGMWTR